ncbi:MAG: exodeoxyribonuclease VII small subunit [Anaerolineae bacterium]|nr:exodeoxyribonuclease VII small subunit [Anaerolineae bacterium]MCO5187798.1 exodeoxyribonuclease VII small subunit [Anaerolineae bacterium]MCO5191895.1 exodeoxyribonuclease VII small subunit [Anaerolineae bacterium]MCO5197713.1 exodeoxyribonuclease VII small subunit [Anaerolineae bacterium]MCO5206638.1 exodeoxyribonuclease VII small subunit [Anaerolineae bacterium]
MEDLTFEDALRELESSVAQLEAGELTLEAALALYERGQKLSDYCAKMLAEATLRVEQLSADGEIITLDAP